MPEVKRLLITLTERCNMRCPHCWISAGSKQEPYQEITLGEIVSSIDKLLPVGLEAVKLTGGEPLLRKDIVFGVIDYCGEKGLKVSLETNAVLLTDDDICRLNSQRFVEVGTSLDFPSADEFDAFRGYPGVSRKSLGQSEAWLLRRRCRARWQFSRTI